MNLKAGFCDFSTFTAGEDIAITVQYELAVMPLHYHLNTSPFTSIVVIERSQK